MMLRSFWQFLTESVIAYPIAVIAALIGGMLFDALLNNPDLASDPLVSFLGPPILGIFWLTSVIIAWLVHRRARSNPNGLFASGQAGEWVWVLAVAYIVWLFLLFGGVGWQRRAIVDIFTYNPKDTDLGNLPTAPFYMGIAYSATRYLLRRHAGQSAVKTSSQAG